MRVNPSCDATSFDTNNIRNYPNGSWRVKNMYNILISLYSWWPVPNRIHTRVCLNLHTSHNKFMSIHKPIWEAKYCTNPIRNHIKNFRFYSLYIPHTRPPTHPYVHIRTSYVLQFVHEVNIFISVHSCYSVSLWFLIAGQGRRTRPYRAEKRISSSNNFYVVSQSDHNRKKWLGI